MTKNLPSQIQPLNHLLLIDQQHFVIREFLKLGSELWRLEKKKNIIKATKHTGNKEDRSKYFRHGNCSTHRKMIGSSYYNAK